MTIPRFSTRLLLRPEDMPPSRLDFEVVEAAFNPRGRSRRGTRSSFWSGWPSASASNARVHRPAEVETRPAN